MTYKGFRNLLGVSVTLAALVLPVFAGAQTRIQGVIDGRSGPSMTVKTPDSGNVTVLPSDNTQVIEPEGVFRKKHLALTALIPRLQVKVKGSYNPQNQLLADSVEFKASSLQSAQDIQAGVDPRKQQLQATEQQVQSQQQDIQQQQAQLKAEQQATAEHAAEIAADKAAHCALVSLATTTFSVKPPCISPMAAPPSKRNTSSNCRSLYSRQRR